MKKLVIALTALVGVASVMPAIINKTQQKTEDSALATAKEWNINPFTVKQEMKANEWLYFAIDNINLSSMGINSINDLHKYNTIEISGLSLKYDDYQALSGDSWKANRNLGSENWYEMFKKTVEWCTMTLESASTIWYNNSGNLMMRLAYHATMIIYIPPNIILGGVIAFNSGSVVKFY